MPSNIDTIFIITSHTRSKYLNEETHFKCITASGVITEFVFENSNIGQKRRREGSTTAVRADKFIIYKR